MKDSTDYGVLERRQVPERGPVHRDEILFLYRMARGDRDLFLRRIEVWDEEQQRTLVFLINHRRFAASTIAQIYKSRWQIELSSQGTQAEPASRPSSAPAPTPCRSKSGPPSSPCCC
jgi:hypothetical protein